MGKSETTLISNKLFIDAVQPQLIINIFVELSMTKIVKYI